MTTLTTYAFQLRGGVSMPPFSYTRQFATDQEAINHCKDLMESFEGARAVYGINCFKMKNDKDGDLIASAAAKTVASITLY